MSESTSTPAPKPRKKAAKPADEAANTPAEQADAKAYTAAADEAVEKKNTAKAAKSDTPAEAANATADAVEEATAEAQAAVETVTADSDAAVASAADHAAETVADAANEAATEAAATMAAADAANETAEAQHAGPVRTVYVTAPTPPAPKGNRVAGILIGLLAAAVFATIYAAVFALLRLVQGGSPAADLPAFLGSASFIFPIVILLIALILWALLVNRAGWWAWILGSFLIALAVYAGTIGLAQLFYQVQIPWTEPVLIASAVLAREVTVWLGGILSARGKRLKVRNAEARAQFDREEAERRAERERHA